MTEKTRPRSASHRFYDNLLLRAGATAGEIFFLSSLIVEVGLASWREQIPVLDSHGPAENLRKLRELSKRSNVTAKNPKKCRCGFQTRPYFVASRS